MADGECCFTFAIRHLPSAIFPSRRFDFLSKQSIVSRPQLEIKPVAYPSPHLLHSLAWHRLFFLFRRDGNGRRHRAGSLYTERVTTSGSYSYSDRCFSLPFHRTTFLVSNAGISTRTKNR